MKTPTRVVLILCGLPLVFFSAFRMGRTVERNSLSRKVAMNYNPAPCSANASCVGMAFSVTDRESRFSAAYQLDVVGKGIRYVRELDVNGKEVFHTTYNGYTEIPWYAAGWSDGRTQTCILEVLAFTARNVPYVHGAVSNGCEAGQGHRE